LATCQGCDEAIAATDVDVVTVVAGGGVRQTFHNECLRCIACDTTLVNANGRGACEFVRVDDTR
jgi:hypothetical protein